MQLLGISGFSIRATALLYALCTQDVAFFDILYFSCLKPKFINYGKEGED